jgi:RNA polymerase sigma-70 factor (ECF subfamily)
VDDATTLARIRAGDRAAFGELIERHQQAVFRVVRNLLPRAAECEDVAQDVFLSAFARLASFDPSRASFRTWLLTIARNGCLNALKRRRPLLTDFSGPESHPADLRHPEEGLERAELFRRLDEALESLPFEQRTAFVLAELEGLSLEEVGRVENVPVGTVKSRLGRAREKLRVALADLVG